MSRKWAISLILGAEVLIYLFLLVGIPLIEKALCPTCNTRELFTTPLILYLLPGLIGLGIIALIWKQKKEVKEE